MGVISTDQYEKSLKTLEQAFERLDKRSDEIDFKITRDACIQRFEFCVELAWKTSIKYLGLTTSAPKPALRDMARAGLIDDFDKWFDFLMARNKSSHTYDEDIAKEVLSAAQAFIPEGNELLKRLKAK